MRSSVPCTVALVFLVVLGLTSVGCASPVPDCEDGWHQTLQVLDIHWQDAGSFELEGTHYRSCTDLCATIAEGHGPVRRCSYHDSADGSSDRFIGSFSCEYVGATCTRTTFIGAPNLDGQ